MEYWILQHNPEILSLDCPHPHEVPLNRDYWNISRYANDISVNDMAFIWHAGSPKRRGIYNVATIVSVPPHNPKVQHQIVLLQQSEDPCWKDKEKRDRLRDNPSLLIEYQFQGDLQPPILLEELQQQGFSNLPVIRMPQSGIYRLDQTVGERLLEYIEQTRGRRR